MKLNNKTNTSNYRLSKDTTAHFTSLSALTGYAPKRTKDAKKLEKQREDFMKRYGVCKVCGGTWKYVKGSNLLVCSNPDCKGLKPYKGAENKDIKEDIVSTPNVIYLRSHSAEIADTIFD